MQHKAIENTNWNENHTNRCIFARTSSQHVTRMLVTLHITVMRPTTVKELQHSVLYFTLIFVLALLCQQRFVVHTLLLHFEHNAVFLNSLFIFAKKVLCPLLLPSLTPSLPPSLPPSSTLVAHVVVFISSSVHRTYRGQMFSLTQEPPKMLIPRNL